MFRKTASLLCTLLLALCLLTACGGSPDAETLPEDGSAAAETPAEDAQDAPAAAPDAADLPARAPADGETTDAEEEQPPEDTPAEKTPVEEPPAEEPAPEPEPEPVDPESVLLPNFADFLLLEKRFNQGYGDVGHKYSLGPIPDAAREDVVREVFELVEDPRYQLELDFVEDNYYEDGSGEVHEYYYRYTGTNPAITDVTYSYRRHTFQFIVTVYDTSYKDGLFSLGFYYNENFEEEITGRYTCRRTDKDSDGGLRAPDEFPQPEQAGSGSSVPDSSGIYDHTPPASRLDCLTCKGDGDCNTCGGDGYRSIGGAKAGCRTCHGNGKCRACGGSGKR